MSSSCFAVIQVLLATSAVILCLAAATQFLPHMALAEQETPRPLLTAGEILQLPQDDALVLVSGTPPIRARKLRYYADQNFFSRLLPAPPLVQRRNGDDPAPRRDDWAGQSRAPHPGLERKWSDLISSSSGRAPEQTPELAVAHHGRSKSARPHDEADDQSSEPRAESDAQLLHDDDDGLISR